MLSNTNQAKTSGRECRFTHWHHLLDGTEGEQSFNEAFRHVEECTTCQQRVADAANQKTNWWNEARSSWLEYELPSSTCDNITSSVVIEVQPEIPDEARVEFEVVQLPFLESPRHPELLGRLGRYDIERVIGTGGMGLVLKAHDTELHRVVAIKVLAAHLANNASARKRFAREAQAAAAILHPNVIPIYNVETAGKVPYLVMQCVMGASLQAKVDHNGPLSLAESLRIAKQTASGLAAAHDQGIVHRDVKPANILLEDNVDRVLLSDFGLARAVDDASLTRTGVVAGTPHYMSPEQAHGDALDTRSDQFSLGSVLYFMLTGRPPYRANNAMGVLHRICTESPRPIDEINPDVPVEVIALVARLMSKNVSDRFYDMHAVEAELERLLLTLQSGGLSLQRRKPKQKALFQSWKNRSWMTWAAITSTTAILSLAIVSTWWTGWQEWLGLQRNSSNRGARNLNAQVQQLVAEQNQQIQAIAQSDSDLRQIESELRQIESIPMASWSSEYQSTNEARFYQDLQNIQIELDALESQLLNSKESEKESE